jgi:hypothetical protein
MAASSIARSVMAAVVALCTTACAGGGGGRVPRLPDAAPPATSQGDSGPRSQLEGEWTLVGMETASGPRKASGFMRYDRFANITLHAELAGDDPAARPPRTVVADFTAKASPEGGELDYTGLQMGVPTDRLAPDAAPMTEWRRYELSGDTLRLSVRGGNATLVFQRAR